MTPQFKTTGIIGTGAMGRGIAQMAAQAGSQVLLFDNQHQASIAARDALFSQWDKLSEKGRLSVDQVASLRSRTVCVETLADLAACDLAVEAIVERLDAKTGLFQSLEALVGADTVLVTNTSSLSVTAIAAQLRRPGRFAGLHFFNPVSYTHLTLPTNREV